MAEDVVGQYSSYAVAIGWGAGTVTLLGMAYRRRSAILGAMAVLMFISLCLGLTVLPWIAHRNRVLAYSLALVGAVLWLVLWWKIGWVYTVVGSRYGLRWITIVPAALAFIDDFGEQVMDLFREAYSSLGSGIASMEAREIGKPGSRYIEVRLTPRNQGSAPIVAHLFNEVTLAIGRNGCLLELEDLFDHGGVQAAIEAARQTVDAVVRGRYVEKIQRLPLLGVVAAVGYVDDGGQQVTLRRGLLLPLLKTDIQTYEPYRARQKARSD
jgi:hypothetical protein